MSKEIIWRVFLKTERPMRVVFSIPKSSYPCNASPNGSGTRATMSHRSSLTSSIRGFLFSASMRVATCRGWTSIGSLCDWMPLKLPRTAFDSSKSRPLFLQSEKSPSRSMAKIWPEMCPPFSSSQRPSVVVIGSSAPGRQGAFRQESLSRRAVSCTRAAISSSSVLLLRLICMPRTMRWMAVAATMKVFAAGLFSSSAFCGAGSDPSD
mmetsp:Transcript_1111/g.3066  ORF Transcript_1111/g.3066 Transcript_1111/m.3066 type:complete len:208 (-) Transcript_1111:590-1213(-)